MDQRAAQQLQMARLAAKAIQGTLASGEQEEFARWLDENPANRFWFDTFREKDRLTENLAGLKRYDAVSALSRVNRRIKSRVWFRMSIAASVLLLLGTVSWLVWEQRVKIKDQGLAAAEILPGGNRATLTLADGTVVALSEAHEGIVFGEEDIRYQDGSFVLESGTQSQEARMRSAIDGGDYTGSLGSHVLPLASISTPKGGTYSITLPDGSKVWLNAGSTLRYPTRFSEDARVVELEGEAYFEVVRSRKGAYSQSREGSAATQRISASADQPFLVVTKGQVVEVLGTEFNVSAYADDPETKTTLVEGSVKIIPSLRGGGTTTRQSSNGNEIASAPASGRAQRTAHRMPRNDDTVLRPGQQATSSGAQIEINEVDIEPYTAWRYGKFVFQETPLPDVLRQLSRWYAIEVDYAGLPAKRFNGDLPRDVPLSEALRLIELTSGIRLGLTERRIRLID